MNRILLIEDAPDQQELVRAALGRDFDVIVAGTADEARGQLERASIDLVLLDVMLPDDDGFRFCAELRAHQNVRDVPVVFISGKRAPGDQAIGFSLGADDYVTKPFSPIELKARVEARLRKAREKKAQSETVLVGDLRFLVPFQRVSVHDQEQGEKPVELTPIEFKLLLYMAKRPEQVFTREQLIQEIWGDGVAITDRTVDVHLSNIRRKMARSLCGIRAIHGIGYSFTVCVTAKA